jgi:adenylate cyclase
LLVSARPAPIAERLKAGDAVADHYEEVTVSFADLVGFTALAGRLSPDELVAFLGEVSSRIDRLARAPRRGENQDDRRLVHGRAWHPLACRTRPDLSPTSRLDTIGTVRAVRERWGVDVDVRIGIHTHRASLA